MIGRFRVGIGTLALASLAQGAGAQSIPYATYVGEINQSAADPTAQGWTISGALHQGVNDNGMLGWELNDNNSNTNPTMSIDYGSGNVPQPGDPWSFSVQARVLPGNGSATNVVQWSDGARRSLFFLYDDATTGNIDILYWNASGAATVIDNYVANDNGFHTWAMVHDGTSTQLTYDGATIAPLGTIATGSYPRGVYVGGGSSAGQGALYVSGARFEATLATVGTTRFARVFANHMVLQRSTAVQVYGTDSVNPGSQSVSVAFAGQTKNTTTDANGDWVVTLDPMAANTTGRDLIVTGSAVHVITDVLVGEVWLAAGQSNMNHTVNTSLDVNTPDPAHFPLIRMCNWEGTVGAGSSTVYGAGEFANLTPENFYAGTWAVIDATSVLPQSAVAYYFAQNLAADLTVPIGIVDISYGGTSTEAFISPGAHATEPHLQDAFERPHICRNLGQWTGPRIYKNVYNNNVSGGNYTHTDPALPHPHPLAPGFLYHTGISHLTEFTFKGAIWYQGESNAEFTSGKYKINGNRLAEYQAFVMRTMIADWRAAFGDPLFPVYTVQLTRISAGNRVMWPFYREAQQRVATDLEGVEIALTMDAGTSGSNVHPHEKETIGERLAAIARAKLYGDDIPHGGPTYEGHTVRGNKIILNFTHTGSGLVDNDGGPLRNFLISGPDRNFVPAQAEFVGNTIEVTAASVADPVAVRHAWTMNADVDLYNVDGFSSSSFRTDSWISAPGRRLKVACIGDSITFGSGIPGAMDRYPAQLGRLLGTENFEVRNFGKPGAGIYRPSNKYDNSAEYTAALAYEPDVVLCNLGINDITDWGSYTQDQFETEYFSLVDAFVQSGNTPLIVQWSHLGPLYPNHSFYGDPNIDLLNDWIRRAAANTSSVLLDMERPLSGNASLMLPDHIHPNAAGALEIAETTFCWLDALGDLDGQLNISEFLAVNVSGHQDEDGDSEDWIELHNEGTSGACLSGLYLTNNEATPTLWQIPKSFVLAPGEFEVIFASTKDRATNNAELHTNFELSGSSGYLGLIGRNGTTEIDAYDPYRPQHGNISYGRIGASLRTVDVINSGFESYDSGVGTTNALASGWNIVDIAGVPFGPLRQAWSAVAAEGTYSYIINATELSQTVGATLAADAEYTLRIGMHKGTSGTAVGKYEVEVKAGAHVIAVMDNAPDINSGSIGYRELVFSTTGSSPGLGSRLELVLRSEDGIYIGFDDITLNYKGSGPLSMVPVYFDAPTPGAPNGSVGSQPGK